MKKVYIETYGCQMNEYDTEIVKSVLLKENLIFVDSPDEADVILLNTCSVRENANRKVFGRIHKLRYLADGRPLQIGVIGCMATDFKEKLVQNPKLPIDFIAGPDSYRNLYKLINSTEKNPYDITLSEFEDYADIYPTRVKGVNAWIAIMRGCNNFCSYCIVPYTRGRERSRSVAGILDEVKQLVREGFPQVTLLGQNVNSYNHDGKDFPYLLEKVSEIDGLERIRFTSPHPKDFPRSLIKVVATNPKVCKHIHLPLQAGNTRILDMMRRTYSQEDYLALVDDIKSYYADMVFTTDIIVGFPTETEAEFEDTVKVVEKVQYDSAFIFKYSVREGTIAQKKYKDDVSEQAKTERIIRLNEIQKQISLKKNKAHIGQIHTILLESDSTKKSKNEMQGRNDGNKLVIVPKGNYKIGDLLQVRIKKASAHVLVGEIVSQKNH